MRIISLAAILVVAPIFAQAVPQNDKKEFPALRSSYESGDTFSLHITSAVNRWDSLISEESLAKLTDKEKDQVTLFVYTYTFQNAGKRKVKFLFSDREILMSPLTEILQDFSITLEPGQTKTVKFAATTGPLLIYTSKIAKVWDDETKKWHNHGGGGTTLYTPRWNTIWIEMTEH